MDVFLLRSGRERHIGVTFGERMFGGGKETQRPRRRGVVALFGALLLLLPGAAVPSSAVAAARPEIAASPAILPAAPSGSDAVRVAIGVDVSGSILEEDGAFELEKAAAKAIVNAWPSNNAEISVIGFAGDAPIGECKLADSGQTRFTELSDCIDRTIVPATGSAKNETDFDAVLSEIREKLRGTSAAATRVPTVAFLLTDGVLQVTKNESLIRDHMRATLAGMKSDGVQIWPLGFGKALESELNDIASSGADYHCPDSSGTPRASVVRDTVDVVSAAQLAFARATCKGLVPGPPRRLSGDPVPVTIPAVATSGTIQVVTNNPSVSAEYYDPRGRKIPLNGATTTFDESTFTLTARSRGAKSSVESLHVENPLSGTWTVRLTTSDDSDSSTRASVSAFWQGKLDLVLKTYPNKPVKDKALRIEMGLRTRRGGIDKDEKALSGVNITARISGHGRPAEQVRLSRSPGTNEAWYGSEVLIGADPAAQIVVVARAVAPGVDTEERRLTLSLAGPDAPLSAAFDFEPHTVEPGDALTGSVTIDNRSGSPKRVELALDQPPAGVKLTPDSVRADPGSSTHQFTIAVPEGAGESRFDALVTLRSTDGVRWEESSGPLPISVVPPPPWWQRYWWLELLVTLALLVTGLAFAKAHRDRRRRLDVRGLTIQLYLDDERLGPPLTPDDDEYRRQFEFGVIGDGIGVPRLVTVSPGQGGYVVDRTSAGRPRLATPDTPARRITATDRSPVPGFTGVAISVVDPLRPDAGTPPLTAPAGETLLGSPGQREPSDQYAPPPDPDAWPNLPGGY